MLSHHSSSRPAWIPLILAIAGFWLSSNVILDFLVMPVMHVSGMTAQTDFAATGYTLFWSFNRLELLCAAAILTGVLALRRRPGEFEVSHSGSRCRWALALSLGLLCLTLTDTYILTPAMSGMAMSLNGLEEVLPIAPSMNWLHGAYWLLEGVKVTCLWSLAWLCFADVSEREPSSTPTDVWV